jgi:hypothetical protein
MIIYSQGDHPKRFCHHFQILRKKRLIIPNFLLELIVYMLYSGMGYINKIDIEYTDVRDDDSNHPQHALTCTQMQTRIPLFR